MVQSADGQMWFATRNGIDSYDGRTWQHYGLNEGLAGVDQGLIAIDDQQRIWAVSAGDGRKADVSVFENNQWQKLPEPLEIENVFSLLPIGGESRQALLGHDRGLIHIQDGVYRNLEFENNKSQLVFALARFGNKTFAATGIGLFEINLKSKPELQFVTDSPEVPIKGLAVDPANNQLWVIGKDWLSTFDGQKWARVDQKFDDFCSSRDTAVTAETGPDGALYFGTPTGLFSYRAEEGISRVGMNNGLVSEGVHDLVFDRDGMLWVSCARGVSKIAGFKFSNYGQRQGLFDDEVSAVQERSDGTMVLGHKGGLTIFADQQPVKTVALGTPITCRVHDLAEDSKGNLWVAAQETGVFQVDSTGKTKLFAMQENWDSGVNSVLVDQNDQILIATNGGVFRFQGDRFVAHPLPEDRNKGLARKLFLDEQGRIVGGGEFGLCRQDADGWTHWYSDSSRPINNVFAYLDRSNERPLIGTSLGLCTLDGDEIVKLEEPRIDSPVYFIVEDHQERIWIGTDDGVMRWDGQNLRHFSVKHGLVGRETNRATGKVDAQGRIWIGTANGLSIYRPELDSEINRPPSLNLIRAEAGDFAWQPSERQSISLRRSSLTFHYRAISFLDENEIQVRSWLEGLESDWQPAVRPREWKIHYNFLPPGKYRLHLQAANINGEWSDVVTSEVIRVIPPFSHTSLFYSLILISIAATGVTLHWFVSLRRRRYMTRLEREVIARVSELQQFELRYGVALSCIADGVMTTDMDGVVLFMNPSAEQIAGQRFADVGGRTVANLVLWQNASENEISKLMTHLINGANWNSEWPMELRSPDGALKLVETSTSPLRNAKHELLGAVIAIRDVTDKTRLQKDLANSQKLASLGNLAGGIAHDFNNLLTVIIGNVAVFRNELPESFPQRPLELIDTTVGQARNLTTQLLTFAKGGDPLLENTYLDSLIREAVSIIPPESNTRCELTLATDLSAVEVDVGQFGQVLNNLLKNAIQSMPEGGVINVKACNGVDQSKRVVEIEIQDTGMGIPTDQLDRVFEPYFTTKKSGNGIGLATVYSIIQKHSGKLTVSSEMGVGTSFRIILPASDRIPAVERVSNIESEHVMSGRVLIVDDNEEVRETMAALLAVAGFEVLSVADGYDAIKIYEQEFSQGRYFHAVMLDLTIPNGLGGRETIKELLKIDPTVSGIVISGYSDDQVLSEYKSFGFKARISKPFTYHELRNALDELPDSSCQKESEVR